jgi:hypothetical protein
VVSEAGAVCRTSKREGYAHLRGLEQSQEKVAVASRRSNASRLEQIPRYMVRADSSSKLHLGKGNATDLNQLSRDVGVRFALA